MYIKSMIKNHRGDTIVEVLIAIAIAAFAIGITYATAQRGLHQSVTAKEHNEALNIIENQVSNIKLRFQNSDVSSFNSNFASAKHFCLDDTATTTSTAAPWTPYLNPGSPTDTSPLAAAPGGPYDSHCTRPSPGNAFNYFVDINPVTAAAPPAGAKAAVTYQIFVRWEPVAGGQNNSASQYYRVNGGTPQTLGAVTTAPGPPGPVLPPPASTTLTTDFAVMQYPPFNDAPSLLGYVNGVQFLNCTFKPLGVGDNCPGFKQTYDCSGQIPGTNFSQPAVGFTHTWDPNETCSLYRSAWPINLDVTAIKSVDFIFTNDHWNFSNAAGSEDNNILVFGLNLPSLHQVNFDSYCQVTSSPILPVKGTAISGDNVLPLYWGSYYSHLYVDSNSPDNLGPVCPNATSG